MVPPLKFCSGTCRRSYGRLCCCLLLLKDHLLQLNNSNQSMLTYLPASKHLKCNDNAGERENMQHREGLGNSSSIPIPCSVPKGSLKANLLNRIPRIKKFQLLNFHVKWIMSTHSNFPEWLWNGQFSLKQIFHPSILSRKFIKFVETELKDKFILM